MIKQIVILLFIIAILFITIDLGWTYNQCPEPKIIYKFIPRTFAENEENPIPLDDIFKKMFSEPTPWIGSFGIDSKKKKINDMYISQS
jgi:hypothetical protein